MTLLLVLLFLPIAEVAAVWLWQRLTVMRCGGCGQPIPWSRFNQAWRDVMRDLTLLRRGPRLCPRCHPNLWEDPQRAEQA